jgi:hypothetical protein
MASSNQNFQLTSLDPNTMKASLIAFLQGQAQFQDYNYSGPNINVLLDILSRNTYLNAFYNNMAFSEMFLDSAQLRDSVVSKAKELNYLPSSVTSSSTSINLTIQTNGITTFEIPFPTAFNGLNSNGSFTFTTDQNYFQTSSNGTYTFSNVNIYEGTYINEVFVVDYSVNNQIFTLSNPTIDITSLSILVSEDAGSVNNYFNQSTNIFSLNGNSQVYFLQATKNNQYEFQFGDGILGYQPQNGATILANYRVSFGSDADQISSFTLNDNLGSYNNGSILSVTITASANSTGGANAESIDSIKFNAPRAYQTQDRAVTSNDYADLILKNFPQVGDVNVYGGGITSNGVNFGTVYIASVSQAGNPLTMTTKNSILSFINDKNIIAVNTQIVDANTLFLNVTTNVNIDFTTTNTSASTFQGLVTNTIINFSNTNIESFATPFRYSKLTDAIDGISDSVVSNDTSVQMKRLIPITFNTNTLISFTFNNPILNLTSSQFIVNGVTSYITDSGGTSGQLFLVSLTPNNSISTKTSIGTINYNTGAVSIPNLVISNYNNNVTGFYFTANPTNKDIFAIGNDIIEIDSVQGLTVNILSA